MPFELSVDLTTLAILAVVAFIAGFIDAIAGGGGLLTTPALLTAGMPHRPQGLSGVDLHQPAHPVDGTAVFLTVETGAVPNALLQQPQAQRVLHQPEPVCHRSQP